MGTQDAKGVSFGVACARVFWMMVGPMALAILAFGVAERGGGWLTGLDIAYLVTLAAMLAARWLEFPAAGLRRYLVTAASVGLAVWAGANVIGNSWPGW
jgi:hypothetical protein